jgi:hypothetical protein
MRYDPSLHSDEDLQREFRTEDEARAWVKAKGWGVTKNDEGQEVGSGVRYDGETNRWRPFRIYSDDKGMVYDALTKKPLVTDADTLRWGEFGDEGGIGPKSFGIGANVSYARSQAQIYGQGVGGETAGEGNMNTWVPSSDAERIKYDKVQANVRRDGYLESNPNGLFRVMYVPPPETEPKAK